MNIENLTDADKIRLFPRLLEIAQSVSDEFEANEQGGDMGEGAHELMKEISDLSCIEQPTTQPIFDANGWREMGPKECPDRKFNDQVQYEHGESWATTMRMGERSVSKIKDALFVYSNLRYRTRRPLPQTEGK